MKNSSRKSWLALDSLLVRLLSVCRLSIWRNVRHLLAGSAIELGSQDVSAHESGAYTGEISGAMLKDFGVRYAIVGHSERRQYHGETDEVVAPPRHNVRWAVASHRSFALAKRWQSVRRVEPKKWSSASWRQSFTPMAIASVKSSLAYEPVWAIGTGKTASPEQAQQVHACDACTTECGFRACRPNSSCCMVAA
jgi:triosephosphate isomerase